jgi:quinolinate synthase
MIDHVKASDADTFVVATETGMLHPLELEAPGKRFVPANRAAVCQFMKMITLPKLRDALRDGGERYTVTVDPAIAERARVPIERMVSIS